jgi:mannitol/fructose-specific phosphotransferase system IIA component
LTASTDEKGLLQSMSHRYIASISLGQGLVVPHWTEKQSI